jgi:hypothetical protein
MPDGSSSAPGKPARQHLAHHPEIVPRREFGVADVEGPVVLLGEPFLAGDDHRADGIGARNMRIVVDLDAPGRCIEREAVGDALEQRLLACAFRQLPAQRLPGVVERMLHEVALLAALRHKDADPPAGAARQRLGHQLRFAERVREENLARRRPVLVELRHEGFQHLGVPE